MYYVLWIFLRAIPNFYEFTIHRRCRVFNCILDSECIPYKSWMRLTCKKETRSARSMVNEEWSTTSSYYARPRSCCCLKFLCVFSNQHLKLRKIIYVVCYNVVELFHEINLMPEIFQRIVMKSSQKRSMIIKFKARQFKLMCTVKLGNKAFIWLGYCKIMQWSRVQKELSFCCLPPKLQNFFMHDSPEKRQKNSFLYKY